MRLYKKVLIGIGLLGLSSLVGCRDRSDNKVEPFKPGKKIKPVESKNRLELIDDGMYVHGRIGDTKIDYYFSDFMGKEVCLILNKKHREIITIGDGRRGCKIDGNINYFHFVNPHSEKYFFCRDNGNTLDDRCENLTEEEIRKLVKFGNEKLREIYEICKEKFGDELKIPYKE